MCSAAFSRSHAVPQLQPTPFAINLPQLVYMEKPGSTGRRPAMSAKRKNVLMARSQRGISAQMSRPKGGVIKFSARPEESQLGKKTCFGDPRLLKFTNASLPIQF